MRVFSELTLAILVLFIFSVAVEADTEEDFELQLFNPDLKFSRSEVLRVLKEANLTKGYKVEVSTIETKRPGGNKSDFKKLYFFYKLVNCSRIQEIEQELDALIPGVFGNDVANRLRKEVRTRHLDKMGLCKVGLEIDFQRVHTYQLSKRWLFGGKKSKGKSGSKPKITGTGSASGEVGLEISKDKDGNWSVKFTAKGKADASVSIDTSGGKKGGVSKGKTGSGSKGKKGSGKKGSASSSRRRSGTRRRRSYTRRRRSRSRRRRSSSRRRRSSSRRRRSGSRRRSSSRRRRSSSRRRSSRRWG